jgi:hypothetical protein
VVTVALGKAAVGLDARQPARTRQTITTARLSQRLSENGEIIDTDYNLDNEIRDV